MRHDYIGVTNVLFESLGAATTKSRGSLPANLKVGSREVLILPTHLIVPVLFDTAHTHTHTHEWIT